METYTIRNLSFRYPNTAKNALDGITATVKSGEFVTICGKSGCGKSTLLRHLKPICVPHGERRGEVLFCGRAIDGGEGAEDNIKIGMVTQNAEGRAVTDKVWHELAFGPESIGLSQTEIRARVAETAAFFGIESWFYKNVSELSGGQLQLLNLASVMTMQPSVLLLDEPTSQLDPIAARELLETVSRLNRETGVTVILTEHRLEDAFALSDRAIVMEDGKIAAVGEPHEIGDMLRGSDMAAALPAATRVYISVDGMKGKCPISVKEGRELLCENERLLTRRAVEFPEKPTKTKAIAAAELKNVFFRYEKNSDDVIKGLSLTVNRGELFAICGGNGAGKSTALSVISGINKPYRGSVKIFGTEMAALKNRFCGCIGVLPQNPTDLFVKKTVRLELEEMFEGRGQSLGKAQTDIQRVANLCKIGGILDCHPYDISGGEQQRVALAKVLLSKPKMLILDEPTKGMDAHFKISFAGLLKRLQTLGVTIIMVSHDIEFCAEYADRAAIFFDGSAAAVDEPHRLFAGKSFYTTAASRMSRGIIENAVTVADIVSAFGGGNDNKKDIFKTETVAECDEKLKTETDFSQNALNESADAECGTAAEVRKTAKRPKKADTRKYGFSYIKTVLGIICAVLLAVSVKLFNAAEDTAVTVVYQMFSILAAAGCALCLIPRRDNMADEIPIYIKKRKITARTAICATAVLAAVPLTVFWGFRFLQDKKYYFISLMIIAEVFIPFVAAFEGRKPMARELVITSVLCAVGVAGRVAFYSLQQFKPVAAVVIIAGVCLGAESGFLVGALCAFVSNFFFGQGPWTPWQMAAFGMIGFFAGIIFRSGIIRCTKRSLCSYGALSVMLIYGGIMNPASVVLWKDNPTFEMIIYAYAMGFPFDMIHAAATVFFLWLAAEPMIEKIERIKIKYGFF